MASTTISFSDQVVKIEELVESLGTLHDTIRTEARNTLSDDSLVRIVVLAMNNEEFKISLIQGLVSRIGINRLATEIVKVFEAELIKCFNEKLDLVLKPENIEAALANYSVNKKDKPTETASPFQIEKPINELNLNNTEDVKDICRRLANQ